MSLIRRMCTISSKAGIVVRVTAVAVLAFLSLVVTARPVFACEIAITPATAAGKVGDEMTFTINVRQTHRYCMVPIDETGIRLQNMELVSGTSWQSVSSSAYSKQVNVRLTKAGEGSLEVTRECYRGGDYGVVKVAISDFVPEASNPPVTIDPSQSLPDNPNPTAPTQVSAAELPESETGWPQVVAGAIKRPNIIATIVFTALAIVFFIKRRRRFRYPILLASMGYLGFALGGCLCALGALQNVILRVGEIRYRFESYLLLGIPVVTAVFLGRVFCGWVCPMGAVQNFVFRKETGKHPRRFEVTPRIHNVLRYIKYALLGALVVTVVLTKTTVFSSIDPFKALFNLDFVLVPTIILAAFLGASLVIGFPWCKYACPLGAFFALFSRHSLFKIKINEQCTNCQACHTTFCDYRAITAGETRPGIDQMECVRCGECLSRCPHGAIEFVRH